MLAGPGASLPSRLAGELSIEAFWNDRSGLTSRSGMAAEILSIVVDCD